MAQLDLLEMAGAMLERYEIRDISESGLLQTNNQHGMATSSGLNDYDYQNLSSLSLGQKQLNQIQTVNKIPIPTEILEHFKHIKCHCMMGLFPEIGRAWLTIDSEIYIWTYEQTRDVAYYDGLSQLITSVGLVKPKNGIFKENIKYLLILTTGIEIVILGVTFGDTTKTISSPKRSNRGTTTFEEMLLMNKPIFIVNTDNVTIRVVKGCANGRIFLGGKDGCLYEIVYQAESSWFGRRCKKINHSRGFVPFAVPNFLNFFSEEDPILSIEVDDCRNILYVLTEKGSIEAWDMGSDGTSMRRICRASYSDISNNACNIMKTIDPTVFKSVKSICVLNEEDYPNLNIIAVTECGVRLYFSANPPNTTQNAITQSTQQQQTVIQQQLSSSQSQSLIAPYQSSSPTQALNYFSEPNKPQGLYLRHIRLPPGYTPNTTINKPRKVHLSYHKDGTLLLVSTPQQDQDILWSISSAPFPNRAYLTESTTVLPLDGIVWSVGEMRDRCKAKLQSLLRKAQTPKKIALLTNQGAHIIALLKPVDILQQLLVACQGPHHEAVKAFFQVQSEREACATCLLLACSEQYRGTEIGIWAAQAFLLYGGEPALQNQNLINTHGGGMLSGPKSLNTTAQTLPAGIDRNTPHMLMSTPMPNQAMGRPLQTPLAMSNQQSPMPLSPIAGQNVYGSNMPPTFNDPPLAIYSAKHDGLYLYVSRLLRPIWKMRCTDDKLQSAISQEDCALILDELNSIKAFLDANSINEISLHTSRTVYNSQSFSNGYNTSITNYNPNPDQRNLNDQVQAEEKRSLTALNYFIKHACEVLALWKILCEHQFQILANALSKEQQSGIRTSTFRDMVFRFDACAWLIVALINSYLSDNASVSSISSKLRELCPTLYRHEDAVTFKATEILMQAKICNNVEEREEKLRTALQLCKDAAPTLPLQTICQQFTYAQFYEGVIELCATCATKSDPEEFGIHYYNNDEPVEDREGYAAFASRMGYYKEVQTMLESVYQTICSANTEESPSFQNSTTLQPTMSTNAQIMRIVTMAVQIKDPILHATVYEWLMMHDMLSELLALSEVSLGEYLRRSVVRGPDNLKLIDLLWKYYEKNGHHSEAARILDNLASSESDNVSLEQRIEYLARAVMCMRNDSVGYTIANGVLLKELEDKLEIARVQKSLLDAVTTLANVNRMANKAIAELNRTLYDITQLYQNFAEPFELWECKLTILNCSHHNDIILIQNVWAQIINKCVEGTGSANARSVRLFTKFENLVREFGESRNCFPLAFLIKELEIKACQLRLPEGTVPEKLFALNLDREILLEYYLRMISMNERVWANEGNEWHLVQSSIRVVAIIANDANTIWQRSKRRVLGKAQDILSACLNLCYQKPGTERLQQNLKELQCRLQRISA